MSILTDPLSRKWTISLTLGPKHQAPRLWANLQAALHSCLAVSMREQDAGSFRESSLSYEIQPSTKDMGVFAVTIWGFGITHEHVQAIEYNLMSIINGTIVGPRSVWEHILADDLFEL